MSPARRTLSCRLTVHAQQDINMLHLLAVQAMGAELTLELGVTPAVSAEQPLTIDALAALPPPTERPSRRVFTGAKQRNHIAVSGASF
jgi:hypothetical protein